jgi:hypothetical protein
MLKVKASPVSLRKGCYDIVKIWLLHLKIACSKTIAKISLSAYQIFLTEFQYSQNCVQQPALGLKKVAVVPMLPLFRDWSSKLLFKAGDHAGRCSEVVVNTGLTVHYNQCKFQIKNKTFSASPR